MDIGSAVWNVDWYHLDSNNQKLVAMMILRSQNAKFIKVPFFEVTLNAFAKVKYLNNKFMKNISTKWLTYTHRLLDYEHGWILCHAIEQYAQQMSPEILDSSKRNQRIFL